MDLNTEELYCGHDDFLARLRTAVVADLLAMDARIEALNERTATLEDAQGTPQPDKLAVTARQLRYALGDALETNFDEGGAMGDMTHRRLQKLWEQTAWVEEG